MKRREIVVELTTIFWLFILGSILGYIFEMIVAVVKMGYFESRQGLIYGPFTPVYGIGLVIYYLILDKINIKEKTKIFFITMVLGGITEYICSYVQEKVFGTISWDYSNLIFNINGRTSLLHCIYWGIAGLVYFIYIKPMTEKLKQKLYESKTQIITIIVSIFMIFDIGITCIAANRQTERRRNISPENKMDIFLDKHYPDEYMDKIFANKKEII